MSNLQQTLEALQPYVIGIRYVESTPVIDVVYKDGWTVVSDKNIKMVKGENKLNLNYFMLFGETDNIGIDELLANVTLVIKINQEREKKHELFKETVNDLKNLFKQHSLTELNRIKISILEEKFTDEIDNDFISFNEFDVLDTNDSVTPDDYVNENVSLEEPKTNPNLKIVEYLDENNQPIKFTPEELEEMEEEARGKRNIELQKGKQKPIIKSLSQKVELPPKKTLKENKCNCINSEGCDRCMDI
jgi:hypothetical protein